MKFILQDEIKQLESAKQVYKAANAFDNHSTLVAKSNVNALLASKEGLAASFGAGFVKGAVSQKSTSSSSNLSGLSGIMQLLLKL